MLEPEAAWRQEHLVSVPCFGSIEQRVARAERRSKGRIVGREEFMELVDDVGREGTIINDKVSNEIRECGLLGLPL